MCHNVKYVTESCINFKPINIATKDKRPTLSTPWSFKFLKVWVTFSLTQSEEHRWLYPKLNIIKHSQNLVLAYNSRSLPQPTDRPLICGTSLAKGNNHYFTLVTNVEPVNTLMWGHQRSSEFVKKFVQLCRF